jgi:hypothetical protein
MRYFELSSCVLQLQPTNAHIFINGESKQTSDMLEVGKGDIETPTVSREFTDNNYMDQRDS